MSKLKRLVVVLAAALGLTLGVASLAPVAQAGAVNMPGSATGWDQSSGCTLHNNIDYNADGTWHLNIDAQVAFGNPTFCNTNQFEAWGITGAYLPTLVPGSWNLVLARIEMRPVSGGNYGGYVDHNVNTPVCQNVTGSQAGSPAYKYRPNAFPATTANGTYFFRAGGCKLANTGGAAPFTTQ